MISINFPNFNYITTMLPAYGMMTFHTSRCILQGSGEATYGTTDVGGYNNGEWQYVRVVRSGNRAQLEDISTRVLASVEYGEK